MEDKFELIIDNQKYIIERLEESFNVYASSIRLGEVRRTTDEFVRWEQLHGVLDGDTVLKVGELIENYYK